MTNGQQLESTQQLTQHSQQLVNERDDLRNRLAALETTRSEQEANLARADAHRKEIHKRAERSEDSLKEATNRMGQMDEYMARLQAEVGVLRRQRAVMQV